MNDGTNASPQDRDRRGRRVRRIVHRVSDDAVGRPDEDERIRRREADRRVPAAADVRRAVTFTCEAWKPYAFGALHVFVVAEHVDPWHAWVGHRLKLQVPASHAPT